MKAIILFGLLLVLAIVAQASLMRVAAKWGRAGKPTFWRAMATIVLGVVCIVPLNHLLERPMDRIAESGNLAVVLIEVGFVWGLDLLIIWIIIKHLMKTRSIWRAALVWLTGQIISVVVLVLLLLVVRPYVLESFVCRGNSMAPTLLGEHQIGRCPYCGGPLVVPTMSDPRLKFMPASRFTPESICGQCMRFSRTPDLDGPVQGADRFLVDKLRTARRWDMVVFRSPDEPSVCYVKRLVGLPGESIFIKDGAVWIGGVRQTQPNDIAQLKYELLPYGTSERFIGGTEDQPWRLKSDEYLLLGDFTKQAKDSRLFGPVPGEDILGVVAANYWPLTRLRVW